MRNGKPVDRDCKFKDMDPKLDVETGLLVAGNRLCLSDLVNTTKHPIILPAKEPLVEKLILHFHTINSHAPQDTTIALLRERFHIIHIRREVRRVVKQCLLCRRWNTKPSGQKMGILPEERASIAPAFSCVGLDFTGPLYIKS